MNPLIKFVAVTTTTLSPLVARAEFGGIIEGDASIYDLSDYHSFGGKFGPFYKTPYGTHYLLGSVFRLEQGDVEGNAYSIPELGLYGGNHGFDTYSTGFGLSYRYGFSFFEKFEPYIEYGWRTTSSTYHLDDALGNPTTLENDDASDYLAMGILYQVWKNLHLKAEIGYHGILSDTSFAVPVIDALGNNFARREKTKLSASIGLSLTF